jgi:hypothetical protein
VSGIVPPDNVISTPVHRSTSTTIKIELVAFSLREPKGKEYREETLAEGKTGTYLKGSLARWVEIWSWPGSTCTRTKPDSELSIISGRGKWRG